MPPIIPSAADYHRLTSYTRNQMTPHHLDWANQPRLDKSYPPLDTVPLDRQPITPTVDYTDLVRRAGCGAGQPPGALEIQTITSLLHLTHALTARRMHGNQAFYFRSVASAGALYPFEIYLAVHDIQGLAPGGYHYDLFRFSLNRLRNGPLPVLPPAASAVAATVYVSGIFFRSAWKYRQRAYRYLLLDAGHLIENLRLALSALGLAFSMELDFDDADIGVLLGLEKAREACLACVHILGGQDPGERRVHSGELAPLVAEIGEASRVSMKEKFYEPIEMVHGASCSPITPNPADASTVYGIGDMPAAWQTLSADHRAPGLKYLETLFQRRSRRNFIPAPLAENQWSGLLSLIAAAADQPASPWVSPTIGILAGEQAPVASGFYLFDTRGRRLGQMISGPLTEPMAAACLDQMWLKHAAIHLLFITDPAAVEHRFGARAYRHAMIEAGRLGQQAYLAATTLGLGACGIGALYDREAADLLQLPDYGALLYLVGMGPVKSR